MLRPALLLVVFAALNGLAGCAAETAPVAAVAIPPAVAAGRLLFSDDFAHGLDRWVVEQQPGGKVTAENGVLLIEDTGGCTVWFREKLKSPVVISYTATLSAKPRVSDLNCFWMATDPKHPDALLADDNRRDGKFASYDSLRLYYVGYGGNDNTTTRFRRYAGDGTKPLLPEHDLAKPEVLLRPGHAYRIQVSVIGDRVQFVRDGETIFDVRDPQALREGWFGFRTVHSRIEVRGFEVRAGDQIAGK